MLSFLDRARKKRANGDAGFTLIELLVVVVILGILIAIAIPVYLNYRKSANDKAAQSDLRNAISTLEVCNSDNNGYPSGLTAATGDSRTLNPASCSQSIKLSSNTQWKYNPSSTTSYVMVTNNSGGSGNVYCYNSSAGGAVKTLASTVASGTTQATIDAAGATC